MIPTQFSLKEKQENFLKKFKCCSFFVVTCCVTCYFDSDSPYIGKCFFRLESCALNRNDRGLSFCYFFLVSFLHFDPLVLCNLIFFGQRIITTIVPLKNIILRLPANNAIGLLSSILSKLFRREVCLFFFLKICQKHMMKEFFLLSLSIYTKNYIE